MKHLLLAIVLALVLSPTTIINAEDTPLTADDPPAVTITKISMSHAENLGHLRLIKLSQAPTNSPSCVDPNEPWHYVISLNEPAERDWYEDIRNAFIHNLPIQIYGDGGCWHVKGIQSIKTMIITTKTTPP